MTRWEWLPIIGFACLFAGLWIGAIRAEKQRYGDYQDGYHRGVRDTYIRMKGGD